MKIIYARKTRVENISTNKSMVNDFLSLNHDRGTCRNLNIVLGLFYEDELIQIMCFGKPRYDYKTFQHELLRECTKLGYRVIGGSSKLFTFFTTSFSAIKSVCCYTPINKVEDFNYSNHYVNKLGFVTEIITKSTKKDYWYTGGYLYKTTHMPTGKYYIGMSERVNSDSINSYLGSGLIVSRYINKYPVEEFSKEILGWYNHPKKLRDEEVKEIKRNISNPYCINVSTSNQNAALCKECLSPWSHRKTCSKYRPSKRCKECGSSRRHLTSCSMFKEIEPCKECESKSVHSRSCPYYTHNYCTTCKGIGGRHTTSCTKHSNNKCNECNAWPGHTKTCSKHTPHKACPECGSQRQHRRGCSKYKKPKGCPECGSASSHLKTCSKFKPTICEECGARSGKHHKECSKYEEFKGCKECGNKSTHKPSCSKYRRKLCDECGSSPHKKVCSKWKPSKPVSLCPGCGTKYHTKTCPIKPRGAKSTSSVE